MQTTRFSTRTDAIDQAIIPALGDFAGEHDVDAIFDRAFEYRVDRTEDDAEWLPSAGFEQAVTDDEFWSIVEDCAR